MISVLPQELFKFGFYEYESQDCIQEMQQYKIVYLDDEETENNDQKQYFLQDFQMLKFCTNSEIKDKKDKYLSTRCSLLMLQKSRNICKSFENFSIETQKRQNSKVIQSTYFFEHPSNINFENEILKSKIPMTITKNYSYNNSQISSDFVSPVIPKYNTKNSPKPNQFILNKKQPQSKVDIQTSNTQEELKTRNRNAQQSKDVPLIFIDLNKIRSKSSKTIIGHQYQKQSKNDLVLAQKLLNQFVHKFNQKEINDLLTKDFNQENIMNVMQRLNFLPHQLDDKNSDYFDLFKDFCDIMQETGINTNLYLLLDLLFCLQRINFSFTQFKLDEQNKKIFQKHFKVFQRYKTQFEKHLPQMNITKKQKKILSEHFPLIYSGRQTQKRKDRKRFNQTYNLEKETIIRCQVQAQQNSKHFFLFCNENLQKKLDLISNDLNLSKEQQWTLEIQLRKRILDFDNFRSQFNFKNIYFCNKIFKKTEFLEKNYFYNLTDDFKFFYTFVIYFQFQSQEF